MARIASVDLPKDKHIGIALRYIYGIGPTTALGLCKRTNVMPDVKVKDLTDDEIVRLREVIDKELIVEGDLRRVVNQNIKRLMDLNCYRGIRHRRGLPVHGQRTKTNARTKRGARRTVAGRRRAGKK